MRDAFNRAIILSGLDVIADRLENSIIERHHEFDDFLRTDYVCLDSNGCPVLCDAWASSTQYPLTRFILKHITSPVYDLNEVLRRIADSGYSELYDNIGQAILICQRLGSSSSLFEEDRMNAEKEANKAIDSFRGELELAFAYGRISENDKEYILEELKQSIDAFFSTGYFATLRDFLKALRGKVTIATEARAEQLLQDIERRLNQNPSEALALSSKRLRARLAMRNKTLLLQRNI